MQLHHLIRINHWKGLFTYDVSHRGEEGESAGICFFF